MIQTFRHKGLKEAFETGKSKMISSAMLKRIIRQLDVIAAASSIHGINVPGFKLHPLKGSRAGEWAVWVTGNWRITFRFEKGDAYDVNLEDYH